MGRLARSGCSSDPATCGSRVSDHNVGGRKKNISRHVDALRSGWGNIMALPGLHVATVPVNEEKLPINQDLPKNSEWRFEVGFGDKVVVKVSSRPFNFRMLHRSDKALASFRHGRTLWD